MTRAAAGEAQDDEQHEQADDPEQYIQLGTSGTSWICGDSFAEIGRTRSFTPPSSTNV